MGVEGLVGEGGAVAEGDASGGVAVSVGGAAAGALEVMTGTPVATGSTLQAVGSVMKRMANSQRKGGGYWLFMLSGGEGCSNRVHGRSIAQYGMGRNRVEGGYGRVVAPGESVSRAERQALIHIALMPERVYGG